MDTLDLLLVGAYLLSVLGVAQAIGFGMGSSDDDDEERWW